ncbi:MAG: hypothetical protein KatS3mg120_0883 [Erythrobacter sp.]|nr:MAG: hypothetical protein KatS3mg120_0883 [Erythrobacter sp.]
MEMREVEYILGDFGEELSYAASGGLFGFDLSVEGRQADHHCVFLRLQTERTRSARALLDPNL